VKTCKIESIINNGERVITHGNQNFFTKMLVNSTMDNLKEKNSFGFHNLPQQILKDRVLIIVKLYHKLLNMICQKKQRLKQWKTSHIIPLSQKGNKAEISTNIQSMRSNKNL